MHQIMSEKRKQFFLKNVQEFSEPATRMQFLLHSFMNGERLVHRCPQSSWTRCGDWLSWRVALVTVTGYWLVKYEFVTCEPIYNEKLISTIVHSLQGVAQLLYQQFKECRAGHANAIPCLVRL